MNSEASRARDAAARPLDPSVTESDRREDGLDRVGCPEVSRVLRGEVVNVSIGSRFLRSRPIASGWFLDKPERSNPVGPGIGRAERLLFLALRTRAAAAAIYRSLGPANRNPVLASCHQTDGTSPHAAWRVLSPLASGTLLRFDKARMPAANDGAALVAGSPSIPMTSPTIVYTNTDEAPALATYSFLPIVRAFIRGRDSGCRRS